MARLGAQPGRQIDDGADRRVIYTILETDASQRRVALRHANAAAKVVPALHPAERQVSDRITHLDGQSNRALWSVIAGQRIVEEDHHAVASEAIKRAFVLANQWSDRTMILGEERHNVFGLRGFGEGSETPQ